MLRTTLFVSAIAISTQSVFAQDDYLSLLDAEAARSIEPPQIPSEEQPAQEVAGHGGISLSGFEEVLKFEAPGSYELFKKLRDDQKHDVLAIFNLGAKLPDIRPVIADLFEKTL